MNFKIWIEFLKGTLILKRVYLKQKELREKSICEIESKYVLEYSCYLILYIKIY